MQVDLYTLYFLAIGTLLLSAAMTLSERHARPQRSRELRLFAAGYATLAAGCVFALARTRLPGNFGAPLANLVMIGGYLLLLQGAARLGGRDRRATALAVYALVAGAWILAGPGRQVLLWNYLSALPIAFVSALTAREIACNAALRGLRSRRIALAFVLVHALFYAGRALLLPVLVERFGSALLPLSSNLTMYEGVLYSVGLPMGLLALLREETHGELLAGTYSDYLTKLGNRRCFFEQGERTIRANPAGARVFLLAFDLDHFKAINDRFGHATGDEVLKVFARVAQARIGDRALLARLGGEEFAALLPCTDEVEAAALAQDVVSGFAEAVRAREAGPDLAATVSVGLAELGADGAELAALLSAADAALYRAKSEGRNRVMAASPGRLRAVRSA
ncbi:GGDEF domain-containing protein [Novosphingobium profundi]|uniref:GGDEF domain-containing protein n=1 Tax=Novosphingobium profundi TaxID=1774954 RepID=UPI001BD94D35|nr:GGDEF domain-containing protein [Novosphingobium profundi]MBT0670930.1 GGDEF domain-containing protein [Novosphingobium profundi]